MGMMGPDSWFTCFEDSNSTMQPAGKVRTPPLEAEEAEVITSFTS